MKVGQALLDVVNRAQRLIERIDVAPTEIQNVVQERRYRDTFTGGSSQVDNWLASKDFKLHYEAAMEGTSYRASEAKKVEQKFTSYFRDGFEAFKPAPVALKASDFQRVCIPG
jgi:hypothetical protein